MRIAAAVALNPEQRQALQRMARVLAGGIAALERDARGRAARASSASGR